jgi:hypothetical protein
VKRRGEPDNKVMVIGVGLIVAGMMLQSLAIFL